MGMLVMFVVNTWWGACQCDKPKYQLARAIDDSQRALKRIHRHRSRHLDVKAGLESGIPRRSSSANSQSAIRSSEQLTLVPALQELLNPRKVNQDKGGSSSEEEKYHKPVSRDDGNRRCTKTLHIFAELERMAYVLELNHFQTLLESSNETDHEVGVDCVSHGYECDLKLSIGVNITALKGKDAVIFGMVGPTWRRREKLLKKVLELDPEPGQTWIYYSTEPPFRVVRWIANLNVTSLKYHVLMSYSSQSDIHIPFGYFRRFEGPDDGPSDTRFLDDNFYTNRTGLISWAATNCDSVFWPRMPFIDELKKLLPLDTYGKCGTKKCLPRRSDECNKLFASYKFYLAIPNSECHDYITEKFWLMSLKYGTVPVVLGAHKKDYDIVAPPNSFVHVGAFPTFSDLADHLKKVDEDDDLYRKYHEWRNQGEVVITYPLKPPAMCKTIPHIRERDPSEIKYLNESPWFRGCRKTPGIRSIRHYYTDFENWVVWR